MTDKHFPQVADDEIMLTQMPHMNLYDDGDFISNILGEYTDKNYFRMGADCYWKNCRAALSEIPSKVSSKTI